MRILIVFGSTEGQTRKVARFVSDRLRQDGHEVRLVDVLQQPPALHPDSFDAVIVAARVHAGTYQRQIIRFVRTNRAALDRLPNAFLSVSMAAANLQPGDRERARTYTQRLAQRTGWHPDNVLHVAGARFYTRHNALGRLILGLVDRHRFDTGMDHSWTDWRGLQQFTAEFSASLAGRQRADYPSETLAAQ